jgi:hypothetical protein
MFRWFVQRTEVMVEIARSQYATMRVSRNGARLVGRQARAEYGKSNARNLW